MDYYTPDPIAKGVWDCFSDDVVCTVHVGIDPPTVCSAKHSPRDPLAHVAFAMSNRLGIQKAARAGMALVDRANDDPDQFRFVLKHLNEAGVRHLHNVLVVPPSDGDLLLPAIVFADHERSDTLLHQPFNDAVALRMEVVDDLAVAPVREKLHQAGGTRAAEFCLQMRFALVVELVDVLQRTTI